MLDNDTKWLVLVLLEFAEEHWSVFLQRAEEHGMTEEQAEEFYERLKKEV